MTSTGMSAIDLCEEAVHLLRRAPASAISIYYLGALPFILGLLFFWTDMSESSVARDRAVPESLAMAVLYIWMIACHAQFARQLRARLSIETVSTPTLHSWLTVAAAQAAIQPTKLLVLPVALLATLPFGSALAFYHNASVMESLSEARQQASLWPKQNWTFLGILLMLALVVFVNVAMALFSLPYLAKMFFGIDTAFTRSAYSFLNTTFLAVAVGVSYLVLNPFVRAFYVLRCFYGESLTTAQDLRAELKRGAVRIPLLLLLLACGVMQAQPGAPPVNGDALNKSIDRVLRKPEYSWRLPRIAQEDKKNRNWLVRNTIEFLDYAGESLKRLGRWIDQMADKLGELVGKKTPPPMTEAHGPPPARSLRTLLVALLAAAVGAVVFLGWQSLARRRKVAAAVGALGPIAIDLNSADLQADQQPLDLWLQMARDCVERGELRQAMRALYLAGLSTLASESLIALKNSKSDRDYARELQRRARNRPEVVAAFARTLTVFERVWYGMYDVDLALIQEVQVKLEQMRVRAQ